MMGLIVRQAATLAALGVVIGLVAVLPLTPLLQSQLYGVTASDPVTLVSVPLGLLLIAALAALVPARRAATADPLVALRAE
jgi:ABC-type antimicrobial peptide transport system permease subunit